MGGKSRKSGGVSRRLIDRLIKEKGSGPKSDSKKDGAKANESRSTGFGISDRTVSGQDEGVGG
jgi:short subunit dehydrogenase-like uncharacterized protein